MPTIYEWDIETVDEHGDIVDHDHSYKLKGKCKPSELNSKYRLVLVRDVCDQAGSVEDRTWGYVNLDTMTLPEYTSDAYDRESYKVPKKFHEELKRFISAS